MMPSESRTARQWTSFFVIGFALVTLGLGLGVYFVSSQAVERQLDVQIAREAAELRVIDARDGFAALERAVRERDARGVNSFGYDLRQGGRHVAGELEIETAGSGLSNIAVPDDEGRLHRARALTLPVSNGGSLVVGLQPAPTDGLRWALLALFGTSLLVVLAIGVVGSVLLDRTIRARLGAMNASARAIIAGDLETRVAVSPRADEFDQLAGTLNTMLDRIHDLIENLRRVSTDIGHDLRTPITRLRQRLERVRLRIEADGGETADVDTAIQEADAILSLFAAMMRISEVESGALQRFFKPVELGRLMSQLAESYELVAEDRQRRLVAEVAGGVEVWGDAELLAQVLVNLLENALRHTPEGATILLRLAASATAAHITVQDDGPGIDQTDHRRVLQRFVRLDSARSSPGNGLGLNLVAAVVKAHGGTLRLLDADPGLKVAIDLPLWQPTGTGKRSQADR